MWFTLKMPDYYSCVQSAGAMFYRQTAIEYRRRSEGLAGLNTLDFSRSPYDLCARPKNPDQQGPTTREQLAAACRALPELDALVLSERVPGAIATEWHPPAAQIVIRDATPRKITTFYRYRCSNLR